jgi:hypothetical protein
MFASSSVGKESPHRVRYFAHVLFFHLAFPDHQDTSSQFVQLSHIFFVTPLVRFELFLPEGDP